MNFRIIILVFLGIATVKSFGEAYWGGHNSSNYGDYRWEHDQQSQQNPLDFFNYYPRGMYRQSRPFVHSHYHGPGYGHPSRLYEENMEDNYYW